LVYTAPDYTTYPRQVYLPTGQWVDYYTDTWHTSNGGFLEGVQVEDQGIFRLPLYARAGAIVPQMWVDDQTMNVMGQRLDGSTGKSRGARGQSLRVERQLRPRCRVDAGHRNCRLRCGYCLQPHGC